VGISTAGVKTTGRLRIGILQEVTWRSARAGRTPREAPTTGQWLVLASVVVLPASAKILTYPEMDGQTRSAPEMPPILISAVLSLGPACTKDKSCSELFCL